MPTSLESLLISDSAVSFQGERYHPDDSRLPEAERRLNPALLEFYDRLSPFLLELYRRQRSMLPFLEKMPAGAAGRWVQQQADQGGKLKGGSISKDSVRGVVESARRAERAALAEAREYVLGKQDAQGYKLSELVLDAIEQVGADTRPTTLFTALLIGSVEGTTTGNDRYSFKQLEYELGAAVAVTNDGGRDLLHFLSRWQGASSYSEYHNRATAAVKALYQARQAYAANNNNGRAGDQKADVKDYVSDLRRELRAINAGRKKPNLNEEHWLALRLTQTIDVDTADFDPSMKPAAEAWVAGYRQLFAVHQAALDADNGSAAAAADISAKRGALHHHVVKQIQPLFDEQQRAMEQRHADEDREFEQYMQRLERQASTTSAKEQRVYSSREEIEAGLRVQLPWGTVFVIQRKKDEPGVFNIGMDYPSRMGHVGARMFDFMSKKPKQVLSKFGMSVGNVRKERNALEKKAKKTGGLSLDESMRLQELQAMIKRGGSSAVYRNTASQVLSELALSNQGKAPRVLYVQKNRAKLASKDLRMLDALWVQCELKGTNLIGHEPSHSARKELFKQRQALPAQQKAALAQARANAGDITPGADLPPPSVKVK